MPLDLDDRLELHAVADRLGVHYQTAYRWVRTGRLPAQMVGGRYLVSAQTVDEFAEARQTPTAPRAPGPARLDRAAERVLRALVDGDEPTVIEVCTRLLADGTPVIDVLQQVLVPPLHRIGELWCEGALSIGVEHRASAIVDRLLGQIAPNPRGRRRGTAIVAGAPGDQHALPTTMAALALRDDNWHVHHLGPDLPVEELDRFRAEVPADVVVITAMTEASRVAARAVTDRLEAAGVAVIAGGAGQTLPELLAAARTATGRRSSR